MDIPNRRSTCIALLLVALAIQAHGDDWPQWRGPKQDGISSETGLLAEWPEKGPPQLWRVPLGSGFSAVSVLGDKAYTCFGTADGEFATCLNAADGKTAWKTRLSDLFSGGEYGDGPRATPTIEAGRVYVLSGKGALRCLDAADGHKIWGCDLLTKFGGKLPEYGFAASPIVVGDMLVVVVGAGGGKSLAAFDKADGKVRWTALDDLIGYSTPRAATIDGIPQIIVLMGEALVCVSPADGKEFWRIPWKTEQNANVTTPILSENRLFVSTGYSTGCAQFELSAKAGKPAAEKRWANKEMKNFFATSVLLDGYLFGFNNNKLTCLDFRIGKTKWKADGTNFNRGSLLVADGKLIIVGAAGTVALAEASPKAYREISKFQFCDDRTWTVPTLSGGRLFVRNEKELACFKVSK